MMLSRYSSADYVLFLLKKKDFGSHHFKKQMCEPNVMYYLADKRINYRLLSLQLQIAFQKTEHFSIGLGLVFIFIKAMTFVI
ncbi:hypothetical protein, partial [uncultured Shewanella sp.]|uniref:hypothetical protein n=1 Tax=uncultured Shewanella sp. TaxID=173975 RepID=UPI00260C5F82